MKVRLLSTQVAFVVSALLAINSAVARTIKQGNSASSQVRGAKPTSEAPKQRRLPKRPSGHSHSTSHSGYLGCLGLSDSELQSSWKLSGKPPKCQYKHHASQGNSASSGSSSNGDYGNNSGEVEEENQGSGDVDSDGRNSGNENEATDDADQVVNNGNFDNVNGDDVENNDNGVNGDNANNGGNGGNANNGENGGNDYSQNGKNNGNNNGQNQGQTGFNPYEDFDITRCDTYENLWLWDLSLTCEKEGDPSSCECIFAEEMMELGSLSCEDAMSCPRSCSICSRCMQLLGCQVPKSSTSFLDSGRPFYLLAVALGFIVCGIAYYARRRRRRGPSILQKQLLDENSSSSGESFENARVWLAPATHDVEEASVYPYNNAAQLPIWIPPRKSGKTNTDEKPVWLAPDASSQQLVSTVESEEKEDTPPVWLAPDASSEQLKGPSVKREDEGADEKQIWLAPDASSEQLGNKSERIESNSGPKEIPIQPTPDSTCSRLEKPSVQDEDSEKIDEKPFLLAPKEISEEPKSSRIESEDLNETKAELGPDASSESIEDSSIGGSIQFSLSASSTGLFSEPAVNNEDGVELPETVSDEFDGENLPALT